MPENQKRRRAGFHRAELLQVLYDAVRKNPKIQMHVDKRLSKVEKVSANEMKLEFQDGTTTTANLVIGADGIHSVVRSHYMKDDPIFSGLVAYRGLIPMEKVREFWPWDDSDVSGFWTQQGKHFMTFHLTFYNELTVVIPSPQRDLFSISSPLQLVIKIRLRRSRGCQRLPDRKSLKSTRTGIPPSRN